MNSKFLLVLLITWQTCTLKSQDTFSILAFDSLTHEVGAAGASCVDLFQAFGYPNDFICELFPDTGAIACQASYLPTNQANARIRMRAGDTPSQLLSWLNANDVAASSTSNYTYRQYGAIRFVNGGLQTAAFTGTSCMNYKNHRVGRNYTIHGNILLGALVLDSMEAKFKRAKGDLACKLMAAMQGANMVGADSRCISNNSSSLFAFLKVTQPTDTFGRPSLLISLKTHANAQIEPIDSLQIMFDAAHSCTVNTAGITKNSLSGEFFSLFPNPALNKVIIAAASASNYAGKIYDLYGRSVLHFKFETTYTINLAEFKKGIYFVEVSGEKEKRLKKLIVD